ncbi:hypothetical protein H7Y29_02245 [Microbacteriaceae bacterium]|nr:hypothetical protein [Candidatus Saccharibacteria bacterium]
MSELPGHGFNFDESFDSIMAQFKGDATFVKRLEDINDKIDEHDARLPYDQHADTRDPCGAYHVVPVSAELEDLVNGFQDFCRNIGVSPYDESFHDSVLDQITQHVAIETYSIKDALTVGDTVSATFATIIDREDDFAVDYVGDGQRIQGEVEGITLGTIPDDVNALTLEESTHVPLGVGLIIKDPVIIEDDGSRERLGPDTHSVIIALGTLGLKVDKHFYRDDHLAITPLDDDSTD